MALTVDNIITTRVRLILRDIDNGGIQWKDEELIEWFNEACGEIARVRPESTSATIDLPLVAGCVQSIPTGHSRLLEGICNIVAGVESRIIRRAERSTLDNEDPTWMEATPATLVLRYLPSLTDPRSLYVYPPSPGAGEIIRVVTSAPPTVVTALVDACPLPDMYAAPIANYVLFRAFSKLSESPQYEKSSVGYLGLFNSQMVDTTNSMESNNAESRDTNTVGAR